MRISKTLLRKIIKEELNNVLLEAAQQAPAVSKKRPEDKIKRSAKDAERGERLKSQLGKDRDPDWMDAANTEWGGRTMQPGEALDAGYSGAEKNRLSYAASVSDEEKSQDAGLSMARGLFNPDLPIRARAVGMTAPEKRLGAGIPDYMRAGAEEERAKASFEKEAGMSPGGLDRGERTDDLGTFEPGGGRKKKPKTGRKSSALRKQHAANAAALKKAVAEAGVKKWSELPKDHPARVDFRKSFLALKKAKKQAPVRRDVKKAKKRAAAARKDPDVQAAMATRKKKPAEKPTTKTTTGKDEKGEFTQTVKTGSTVVNDLSKEDRQNFIDHRKMYMQNLQDAGYSAKRARMKASMDASKALATSGGDMQKFRDDLYGNEPERARKQSRAHLRQKK